MINAINVPAQIVQPGQNVTFASDSIKTNCSVRHTAGSGLFSIRKPGLYNVFFQANILATEAAQDVQLALEISGEAIGNALAHDTLTAVGDYRSASIMSVVKICDCTDVPVVVSVGNLSETPVTLENSNLVIERIG